VVVAGAHSPSFPHTDNKSMIEDYHRQNLFLALHECVDILAHWLWWPANNTANPFEDFDGIPASMKRELCQALKQGNCAFELNTNAIFYSKIVTEKFKRKYLEYAAELQSEGVVLSFCTDTHSPDYSKEHFEIDDEMFRAAGIDPQKNIFTSKNLKRPAP